MPGRHAFALLVLAVLSGCGSTRTGEVDVFKIASSDAVTRTDRTSQVYVLHGRYFNLSENANRIRDVFEEFDHVGPLRMLKEGERVYEEALRGLEWLRSKNEGERPEARKLAELIERAKRWRLRLADRLGEHGPLGTGIRLDPRWKIEMSFESLVSDLVATGNFLDHLRDTIADTLIEAQEPVFDRPTFELIFEVAGIPLAHDDWNRAQDHVGAHRLKEDRYSAKFSRLEEALRLLARDQQDRIPRRLIVLDRRWADLEGALARLKPILKRVLEQALDLSYAVRRNRLVVDTYPDVGPDKPELRPLEQHIDRMNLNLQKALLEVDRLKALLREPMRQLSSGFIDERVELDSMARTLAVLTSREVHHPIAPPRNKEEPPIYLTIILKSLFVRFLEEAEGGWLGEKVESLFMSRKAPEKRDTELLVTCAVKHQNNVEDAVYPVIFETEFAPGHFVNRHDRIVYGPYPYQGEFLDLRLSVLELDDLNNNAVLSGFSNVASAVGAFNPELAVLSPAVTAMFGAILKGVTENDRELDVSMTFPAPERPGKPDVDMLVMETGHYVFLKRENSFRPEPKLGAGRARMVYRKLIYNAEDGKLYWRRYFSDARSNFTPNNLFTSQSYAVLAVTDEYGRPDALGDLLRRQVGRALGEARGQELIPNLDKSAQLLRKYHELRRDERKLPEEKLNPAERATREKELRGSLDDLWRESTELRQQIIVEALYDRASPEVRQRLGKDPEEWKRASLLVDAEGRFRLQNPSLPLPDLFVPAGGTLPDAFLVPERDPARAWTYQVVSPEGVPQPPAGVQPSSSAGLGSITAVGGFTAAALATQPVVRVRASSIDPQGGSALVLERQIILRASHAFRTVLDSSDAKAFSTPGGSPNRIEGVLDAETVEVQVKVRRLEGGSEGDPSAPLTWWINQKPFDPAEALTGAFAAEKMADGKGLKLRATRANLRKARETLEILGADPAYAGLVGKGDLFLYPHVKATIVAINPLRFREANLVLLLTADSASVQSMSRLTLELSGALEASRVGQKSAWSIAVDGVEKEVHLKDGRIEIPPSHFSEAFLKARPADLRVGLKVGDGVLRTCEVPIVFVR